MGCVCLPTMEEVQCLCAVKDILHVREASMPHGKHPTCMNGVHIPCVQNSRLFFQFTIFSRIFSSLLSSIQAHKSCPRWAERQDV